MSTHLVVNGAPVELTCEARTTLADALREHLRLTGTHLGCEQGSCGACTVLLEGEPVRSCLLFAVQCEGATIRTVEGLAENGLLHPVQRAFHEQHALQCGFCTPGFLTVLVGALDRAASSGERLSDEDLLVLVGSNLCRCTGYRPILAAARQAAEELGVYAASSPDAPDAAGTEDGRTP